MPPGKHLRVHTGDYVKEGDPLVFGPLVPHDILTITGIEAVQDYLVREVQAVYRSQRVDIDDKHIEIIVVADAPQGEGRDDGRHGPAARLGHRQVRLPRRQRSALKECVKIKDPGDSKFEAGKIVSQGGVRGGARRLEAERQEAADVRRRPTPATAQRAAARASPRRRCSRTASSRAASFQETTKVLTEAALAGKVDYLVGLKENVILGHLVPAGTGFHTHQEAEVRINAPEAEVQVEVPADMLAESPAA